MQINKRILLLALSISFHGVIMSMLEELCKPNISITRACEITNQAVSQEKEQTKKQAKYVLDFIANPQKNKGGMWLVESWITQQRKIFPDEQYKILVKALELSIRDHESESMHVEIKIKAVEMAVIKFANRIDPSDVNIGMLHHYAVNALSEVENSFFTKLEDKEKLIGK